MMVITTLAEKRRQKQWRFERSVLRHLSLKELKKYVETHFRTILPFQFVVNPFLIDPAMDLAIDAYLIGAEYSRLSYFGETDIEVKNRCELEIEELTHSLFHVFYGWIGEENYGADSLAIASEVFIDYWWDRGLQEGKKRYRLKLH